MSLRIDHVVYAVGDLDAAATRFDEAYGLVSTLGGLHPRWGTGNRIIPLGGRQYLELLAIVEPETAANTVLGRAIAERLNGGDRCFALCLGDDEIEATAARLGLALEPGSRTLPDGGVLGWRSAGIDDPARPPDLPFFIEWAGDVGAHPGAGTAPHPSGARDIAWIEIAGDAERFAAWTGEATLPVRFVDGAPGVVAVGVRTPGGEVAIR